MKKLLVILLALFLVVSHTTSVFAEGEKGNEGEGGGESTTEVYEIDPGLLNVAKYGETVEGGGDKIDVSKHSDDNKRGAAPAGETVRVSIVLEDPSTLSLFDVEEVAKNSKAISYRKSLLKDQKAIAKEIEKETGNDLDVVWNLTLAGNIISANVSSEDIELIENMEGVKSVEIETPFMPLEDPADPNTSVTTQYMIGASQAWADGYTGAGSLVAIVDTGTNQDHISFSAEGLEYALEQIDGDVDLLTKEDIAAVKNQLNVSIDVDRVYKNTKIPFAYNYRDRNYNTDHKNDTQGEHGSHVSGIAAANRFVKIDGEFEEAIETVYAVGVAPDAQILTLKVFGAGGGAYPSDYMVAIEDAIVLGADSINLSLGSGSAGFATDGAYKDIMDSLVSSSSVVSISAGNAGAWTDNLPSHYDLYAEDVSLDTGGSPGSYINALTVASADNIGASGTPLYFNGSQRVFFSETSSNGDYMASIGGDYEYVYIDAIGNAADYSTVNQSVSLAGKIVIINRGDISFYVKGNNAIAYNPAAVVVADNVYESLGGMNLDGYTGTFPMVMISKYDADALKVNGATAGSYTYYTGTVTVTSIAEVEINGEREDTVMSEFSSWGTSGALLLKPEITSPGGNIWSVNGMSDEYYENMSGTSMAAPQVAGMAGVLGQYIRSVADEENNKTVLELAQEASGKEITKRNLTNSLLMSTATPMKNNGDYVSLLQQGSGLADVGKAVRANAFILMGEDATASAADGKVKAELGQDAKREGVYTYTFTVNNISDEDIIYELDTDLFTQEIVDGDMLQETRELDAEVEYEFEIPPLEGHDVNKDGTTDFDDVQAILDYLTGLVDGENYDLPAGEMNKDDSLTTYDAYLLGLWIQNQTGVEDGQLLVPAHKNSKVTVTITLTDSEKETLDEENKGGAYVEGYTKLTNVNTTDDGAYLDVEHTIPIIGFYGSWTDASMFDNTSYIDVIYETDDKIPYMGNANTNYMTVKYPGDSETIYVGNPYLMDDEFPTERLALNSNTLIGRVNYLLIRNAGTAGWAAFKEDGTVLKNGNFRNQVEGPWYNSNSNPPAWVSNTAKNENINTKVAAFGLSEGDRFTVGYFAIPEYYSLMLDKGSPTGSVNASEIGQLLADGELGKGAYIGYEFVLDDTAPVLEDVKLEDGIISFKVSDNQYIAIVQVMSVDGTVSYLFDLPDQSETGEEFEYSFDVSGIDASAVAVFAGDYAANEAAVIVRLNDGPITIKKDIYQLTDQLTAGNDYVIADIGEEGTADTLLSNGYGYYTGVGSAPVQKSDDYGIYIDGDDVSEDIVWTATTGIRLQDFDGGLLSSVGNNSRPASYSGSNWSYRNGTLVTGRSYLYYNAAQGNFWVSSANNKVFIYAKTQVDVEFDPDVASSVTVTPAADTLIVGVKEETELTATVLPKTLDDKTVTWSSSDEDVATVDQDGKVTAVAIGTATITATSNKTPEVFGTATINVVDSNPLEGGYVYAQVTDAEGMYFAAIDLETMDVYPVGEAYSTYSGGGQSGYYLFGTDEDDLFVTYEIDDDGNIVLYEDYLLEAGPELALLDGFNVPDLTLLNPGPTDEPQKYMAGGFGPGSAMIFFDEELTLPYFDWSSEANFIAATFVGTMEYSGNLLAVYYALADDGMLWLIGVYANDTGGLGAAYGTIGQINMLAIGEDLGAYSMTYAGYIMDADAIFIADNSTKAIYYVELLEGAEEFDAQYIGRLTDAESVTSLFDMAYDTIKDLSSNVSTERVASILAGSPVKTAERLRPAANEAPAASEEPAKEAGKVEAYAGSAEETEAAPAGTLNAIRNYVPGPTKKASTPITKILKKISTIVKDSGDYEIQISEEVTANNGLYTVTYDPDKVAYKGTEENADYSSLNVDEENGEIRFAFADFDGIEAGDVIASFTFEPKCEDSEITVETKERNADVGLSEKETSTIEGIGHAWGEPEWAWAEGNDSATATFVCGNDPEHTETVEADIQKEYKPATATEDGYRKWTATVNFNGQTYTETRIEKIEHSGNIPVPNTGTK